VDEDQIVDEADDEQPAEKVYAGKFKTPEDLEQAYGNAEAEMRRAQQEAAEARKELEQYGSQIGGMSAPKGDGAAPDFNEQIFENPLQAIMQLLTATKQVEKTATVNRKAQRGKFKGDPLFREVSDEFETALEAVDDSYLQTPQQSQFVAEQIYNAVCGKYARENRARASADPAERKRYIENLGIEEPEAPGSRAASDDDINQRDVAMLNALGIGSKERGEVVQGYQKRRERQ
jgi:hypothetical protein